MCFSTSILPNLGRVIFFIFQVSLTQARIDMSELDEDGDGFLQPQVTHIAARYCGLFPIWLLSEICRVMVVFIMSTTFHWIEPLSMVNVRHKESTTIFRASILALPHALNLSQ